MLSNLHIHMNPPSRLGRLGETSRAPADHGGALHQRRDGLMWTPSRPRSERIWGGRFEPLHTCFFSLPRKSVETRVRDVVLQKPRVLRLEQLRGVPLEELQSQDALRMRRAQADARQGRLARFRAARERAAGRDCASDVGSVLVQSVHTEENSESYVPLDSIIGYDEELFKDAADREFVQQLPSVQSESIIFARWERRVTVQDTIKGEAG